MRALLVDDERLARVELRRLLARHPEVAIVGEAADADEARAAVARTQPDLLFLDIQMPGGSGFDLLAALHEPGRATPHRIIFVTAFDEHALRAFEFGAADYLLKPVDPRRLADALRRLSGGATVREADEGPPVPSLGQPALGLEDRVLVRDGERCLLLRVGDLRLAESHGNYARLFFGAGGGPVLVPRALNALQARLDPAFFFRASRRHLVNLRCVEKVEPWFSKCLLLVVAGGHRVEMSRRQTQRFQELARL